MLPNEYEPLTLTSRQQDVHRRYTAMGFKICPRPFAGKGDHLWFFMSLDGAEFTINLQSGFAHRTGTQTGWEMEAAEKEFGATGERQGNFEKPPCASVPVAAADVEPVKPVPQKPVAPRQAVEKPSAAPVKKKQTALF